MFCYCSCCCRTCSRSASSDGSGPSAAASSCCTSSSTNTLLAWSDGQAAATTVQYPRQAGGQAVTQEKTTLDNMTHNGMSHDELSNIAALRCWCDRQAAASLSSKGHSTRLGDQEGTMTWHATALLLVLQLRALIPACNSHSGVAIASCSVVLHRLHCLLLADATHTPFPASSAKLLQAVPST